MREIPPYTKFLNEQIWNGKLAQIPPLSVPNTTSRSPPLYLAVRWNRACNSEVPPDQKAVRHRPKAVSAVNP
jgi:hypothetical protein